MRKIVIAAALVTCILAAAFAEYRYIIRHICPYTENGGLVYIEVFGQVDEYYAEPFSGVGTDVR